jgi:prephenate dehydratase
MDELAGVEGKTGAPVADPATQIVFQGQPGAYSHLACRQVYADLTPLPAETFEDAFAAVRDGRAGLAMIPIENSVAGRVADIHHLMPHCGNQAAIASRLAAEIYGLQILRSDIEDAEHNTTRFVILATEPRVPPVDEGPCITSFLFQVRNVPAALYKALGGFATNGVNMIKLESYVDAAFNQAQFYAEILGHPAQTGVANAFEELAFFSHDVEQLGVYQAHAFRFRAT